MFGNPEAKAKAEPAAAPVERPKYKFLVWKFTINSQTDLSKMSADERPSPRTRSNTYSMKTTYTDICATAPNDADPKANAAEVKIKYRGMYCAHVSITTSPHVGFPFFAVWVQGGALVGVERAKAPS